MTDPISDMLTQIRNAYLVGKADIVLPYSKFKKSLADLLVRQDWLSGTAIISGEGKNVAVKQLKLVLKYDAAGAPAVSGMIRVSKPGQRIYAGTGNLGKLARGKQGTMIVSTPKGLMTARRARAEKVGGEVLCQIW